MHCALNVPTVLDRFIQQAIMQVLQAYWDNTFSEHSYGFRPGRIKIINFDNIFNVLCVLMN